MANSGFWIGSDGSMVVSNAQVVRPAPYSIYDQVYANTVEITPLEQRVWYGMDFAQNKVANRDDYEMIGVKYPGDQETARSKVFRARLSANRNNYKG